MTSLVAPPSVTGLVRACHPIPSIGVTAFSGALAWAAGNDAARTALLALAVLAGQLTIGWSNDLLDAHADRVVGRQDKPIALGLVSRSTVGVSIMAAVVVCVAWSFALGWRAGLLHVAAVACGWIYNLRLKGTWFSWLPYSLAFGSLPGVATLALPGHPAPAWWVVTAGALLGAAANLTNALPDLEDDRSTGFRGLPTRIGARASIALAIPLLVLAAGCVCFGPPGSPGSAQWVGLALVTAVVVTTAPQMLHHAASRVPFYGLMLLVPIVVVMLLLSGANLF